MYLAHSEKQTFYNKKDDLIPNLKSLLSLNSLTYKRQARA